LKENSKTVARIEGYVAWNDEDPPRCLIDRVGSEFFGVVALLIWFCLSSRSGLCGLPVLFLVSFFNAVGFPFCSKKKKKFKTESYTELSVREDRLIKDNRILQFISSAYKAGRRCDTTTHFIRL